MLAAVSSLQRSAPGFEVKEFGEASGEREVRKTVNAGLSRAEKLSLPITFAVLLIAFGAFVAAGLPVLLAFSAVLGSGGLAALASHLVHASERPASVMLLMGMAVGVDYSLFYLKREREERRAGHPDPLGRAAATSGRAVLASGITVLIAMAGMLLSGTKVFDSIGIGAILVVFTAMVGSLTVLPALLGRLGDKVEKGKLRTSRPTSRVWDAVLGPVLRYPKSAALIASAAPDGAGAAGAEAAHHAARGRRPARGASRSCPPTRRSRRPSRAPRRRRWSRSRAPAGDSPAARAALARMRRLALASGGAREPIAVTWNGTGPSRTSRCRSSAAERIRPRWTRWRSSARRSCRRASDGCRARSWAVTGETAGTRDFNDRIKHTFPLVFAFVLGLAFLLLLVAFRSVVIPLSSIALNLLSVGAAYGVLVWIFQDGHLQGLLGFHSNGAVVTWLPLFLFAVLFGLSMDYHVFIVSRIKELRDDGLTTAEAVSRGSGHRRDRDARRRP